MYYNLAGDKPTAADILAQQTSQGFFDRPLAGEALKRDNENFAYALFDIMPDSDKAKWYADMGIPFNPNPQLMQLLAAMNMALPANYMNVSLRVEMTRVALAEELAKGTDPGKLGSMFSEFMDKVNHSFTKFFQRVGHDFGQGLKSIGRNVLSFRAAMIELGGPAMRYVTDFLILTPGVKFVFGDLMYELGGAIVDKRRVQLLPIAAGYAQYLEDMALILNTTSNFLPPPWNLIAKVVAALYRAGSGLIKWQIAEHIQDLMAQAERANAKAREEMEKAMRDQFRGIETELHEAGFMVNSVGGANTVAQPEGSGMKAVLLVGVFALAAWVILK